MSAKKLNIARLNQKVGDIKQALAILRGYVSQDEKEFLNNHEAVRSARYSFIVLIEAATNIANHLCAKYLLEAPESYAEELIGDIDVAVYLTPETSPIQQIDITLSLSTQLSNHLGLPIDIRPLNQTSVGFRFHVTNGELLFSHNEDTRLEFVESTWREYQDFKPLMEQNLRDLLEA